MTTIAETLAGLTIGGMKELQHEMVAMAKGLGMAGSTIVARKAFHDRADAASVCTTLHNDIEAWRAKTGVAGGHTPAKSAKEIAKDDARATVSPGLARLRASQDAEKLRLDTEAQGKAAIEKVAAERQPKEPDVTKKPAKAKKEKPVKEVVADDAPARGRASTVVDTNGKIHLLQKENPKRGECRNRYALYRDGMLVETYIEKVGNRIIAMGDLRWDQRHDFIEIVARA